MTDSSKGTILYIEDDEYLAALVERKLRRCGYTLVVEPDGDRGVDRLRSGGIDLALIDYQLPGQDGLAVLKAVEGDPLLPPLVMVSGAGDLQVAVEAMKHGAADYVVKEGNGSYLSLLPTTIERVLERQRLQEEAAEKDRYLNAVLNNIDQGVSFFDAELALRCWNERFCTLFDLPKDMIRPGTRFTTLLTFLAERGEFGKEPEEELARRLSLARTPRPFREEWHRPDGRVLEVRGGPMPGGGHIATYTDITERKVMELELHRLATTDSLTGAFNRRHFLTLGTQALDRCRNNGQPLALLLLDIDRFKRINDTYGHPTGDAAIRHLVDICRHHLRDADRMGRLGGEEFAILLPGADRNGALLVAERLRRTLAESPFAAIGTSQSGEGQPLSFTVSIGLSLALPEAPFPKAAMPAGTGIHPAATGGSTDEGTEGTEGAEAATAAPNPDLEAQLATLLRLADEALYAAKNGGRNRVVVAGETEAANEEESSSA